MCRVLGDPCCNMGFDITQGFEPCNMLRYEIQLNVVRALLEGRHVGHCVNVHTWSDRLTRQM
jgi:hypothetical protein